MEILFLFCLIFFVCSKLFKSQSEEKTIQPVKKVIDRPKPFRPKTFNQYIGQEKAKEILNSYILGVAARNKVFPHILIHAKAGMGKTTLAKIIAGEIGKNFVEIIASEIETNLDIKLKIIASDGGVVFIDEIHGLERGVCESLYSLMEDFSDNGEQVQEFTLVGATTEIGEIMETRRPFLDRFKIIIELEDYTEKEISVIAEQYIDCSFDNDELSNNVYEIIGKNSRRTPRTAIRLAEASVYLNNDIMRVLKNFNIIENGYTHKDLYTLEYISKNEKGVGLNGIIAYLGTSKANYQQEIEPWLLSNGLILRTPRGRKITEEGKQIIKKLKR